MKKKINTKLNTYKLKYSTFIPCNIKNCILNCNDPRFVTASMLYHYGAPPTLRDIRDIIFVGEDYSDIIDQLNRDFRMLYHLELHEPCIFFIKKFSRNNDWVEHHKIVYEII